MPKRFVSMKATPPRSETPLNCPTMTKARWRTSPETVWGLCPNKPETNWPPSLTTGAVWPWMPTLKATIRGTTPTSPLPTQAARLVGGHAHEVVWMNGLTVNLHLLLASFWRPQGNRTKILMDAPAFPSDTYALKSHLRQRGFDPDEHLIVVNSGTEEPTSPEALEAAIAAAGDTLALGMIAGVNFLTGQVHPIARITKPCTT